VRAALAAALALLLSPAGAWADSPAAPAPQTVVTLSQAIDAALAGGPDIRLADTTLAIGRSVYAQAAAKSSLGLSGNAGASRGQPFVDSVPKVSLPVYSPLSATPAPNVTSNAAQAGVTLTGPSTQVGLAAGYRLGELTTLDHATTLSVSASQTLWDGYAGGRALASVQEAGIALQVQQSVDAANRKSIVYGVKQAYYTLLSLQRQLAVYQDNLARRQEELKRTQDLFDAQNATRVDLKQAQVNLRTAELDLRLGQSTLAVARERLSILAGWPLDRQYSVAEAEDLPVPSLDLRQAVQTAIRQREDLRQLELQRSSSLIDLALKKSQYSPTINATGGVSWVRDWSLGYDLADYALGLQLNVPIIDAGLTEEQVRQAELQGQAFAIQREKLAAGIATDVQAAISTLQDLLARVDLSRDSLDLAQAAYDLAEAQFQSGLIATTDLLTASVNLTTARVALSKARSDAQLGVLALQNAMGD
jgi:outer membrane protein TolC